MKPNSAMAAGGGTRLLDLKSLVLKAGEIAEWSRWHSRCIYRTAGR
ncbi:MAG TPA: hypothetical protein VFZ76_05380 [Anaerolineales bacterium]